MGLYMKLSIIVHLFLMSVIVVSCKTSYAATINKAKSQPQDSTQANNSDYEYKLLLWSNMKSYWDMSFNYKDEDYPVSKNYDIGRNLVNIDIENKYNKRLVPYVDNLLSILNKADSIGNDELYFLVKNKEIPFMMINYKAKKAIAIHSIAVSTVYNTIKLTSKERASGVISNYVLPLVRRIESDLRKTNADYYIIILNYGSKDFSNDNNINNLKAESVAIIIDKKTCRDFIENKITDQESVDNSTIILSDRDSISSDFSRIKVTLR